MHTQNFHIFSFCIQNNKNKAHNFLPISCGKSHIHIEFLQYIAIDLKLNYVEINKERKTYKSLFRVTEQFMVKRMEFMVKRINNFIVINILLRDFPFNVFYCLIFHPI